MRLPVLIFSLAVLAITAGCGARDDSVGPKQPPQLRRDVFFDCEATEEQCAQIQRGIEYLRRHANPLCNMYANSAQARFNAPQGEGFRNEPPYNDKDMSVYTNPTYPSDGYTNVHPKFWAGGWSDPATGALIAHEEYHHNGGGETQAVAVQDMCLNQQA